jgi:phage-related protein
MEFSITGADVDEEWVVFTLGAPNPMRQRFPRDRYIAYSCPWTFNSPTIRADGTNRGAECAYTGSDTTCRKTYADCKEKGNEARFGGFFGLSEDGFRVV